MSAGRRGCIIGRIQCKTRCGPFVQKSDSRQPWTRLPGPCELRTVGDRIAGRQCRMWVRMRLIEALLVPSYRDLAHPSGFTGEARLGVGYQTGDWTPIFRFPGSAGHAPPARV